VPFLRLAAGEDLREQFKDILVQIGVPILALAIFLLVWNALAAGVQTSLGAIPGPAEVFAEARGLVDEHHAERAKAAAFYERQEQRNAARLAEDPAAEVTVRAWTGKRTYLDQIVTSLYTVFTGFAIGTLVAVPLGILCGLSRTIQIALNPLIQIFRPVSPLAWLPIVTLVVSAVYVSADPMFEKSFITSAITVTLCSLWPTLINTALGVASIDKDLINVARVLRLSWWTKVTKIVLPSSLKLIFTGLRLSLGVGWMVLIAAEMLAQNPGLGKFVWDEFQNGSSHSLGRIMVAVFTIGFVGFLLDRIMNTLQQLVSFGDAAH
jgi:nitrate/nitrite transport system permease protein